MMRRQMMTFGMGAMAVAAMLVVNGSNTTVFAEKESSCKGLPGLSALSDALKNAGSASIGGLFQGSRMWAAVVNRSGQLCGAVTSTSDPTQVWPGSQAIAKAKAYTANAFSLDTLALSTAMLYTFTQPGHSLNSLGQSNLFNAALLQAPGGSSDNKQIAGGLIFFGGGVALYENGKIIGGLGVSGDTACADHEVAKTVRDTLNLNPTGGKTADDISYSSVDGASPFTHPLCIHTYRNGVFIGEEANAVGY